MQHSIWLWLIHSKYGYSQCLSVHEVSDIQKHLSLVLMSGCLRDYPTGSSLLNEYRDTLCSIVCGRGVARILKGGVGGKNAKNFFLDLKPLPLFKPLGMGYYALFLQSNL